MSVHRAPPEERRRRIEAEQARAREECSLAIRLYQVRLECPTLAIVHAATILRAWRVVVAAERDRPANDASPEAAEGWALLDRLREVNPHRWAPPQTRWRRRA